MDKLKKSMTADHRGLDCQWIFAELAENSEALVGIIRATPHVSYRIGRIQNNGNLLETSGIFKSIFLALQAHRHFPFVYFRTSRLAALWYLDALGLNFAPKARKICLSRST